VIPIVHHPAYEVDIGPHVFPTRKYGFVRECLLAEGTIVNDDITQPTMVTDEDMCLAHTPEFVEKIKTGILSPQELMILEVPLSAELREAMWFCAGGTLLTAADARKYAVSVHLGGGFHHAFPSHGEGFCLINDVAVAIQVLRRDQLIERALVIDLDVHHGNGTAAIFAEVPEVFTFSMHQQHNYPRSKPPSDYDIGLEDGTDDDTYMGLLDECLPKIIQTHAPEIAFYLAGADPYGGDQLGGLNLTIDGLRKRDELVYERMRAASIPVAVTLAGGYAVDSNKTVEIHCNTVRAAKNVYLRPLDDVRPL
jgi:acetoin utilization deacetylase AcuC-like enzyme